MAFAKEGSSGIRNEKVGREGGCADLLLSSDKNNLCASQHAGFLVKVGGVSGRWLMYSSQSPDSRW